MLTEEEKATLSAFLDAVEQRTTGVWPAIEEHMREVHGIEDPDSALEEARLALQ